MLVRLTNAVHPRGGTDLLSDPAQMPMMGQVNHLPNAGHIRKEPERFFGAEIVERFHDIIRNEGNGTPRKNKFMIPGHPKGQVQLEARALRQFGCNL
jgi:hypothetical protein